MPPLSFLIQDEDGNKLINEYVREHKIGSGSYGKVVSRNILMFALSFYHLKESRLTYDQLLMTQVLYRSCNDGKYYAIKVKFLPLVNIKEVALMFSWS